MSDDLVRRMRAGEEWAVLRPVLSAPGDEERRRVYEAWLLQRGDVLGEVMLLGRLLTEAPNRPDAAALRRRLVVAMKQTDPLMRRLTVQRVDLFNCGEQPGTDPVVRFAYECPQMWETLEPTEDAQVRHCPDCKEAVYLEQTVEGVEARARAGQCVAVPAQIAQQKLHSLHRPVVGRPDPRQYWADEIAWPDKR